MRTRPWIVAAVLAGAASGAACGNDSRYDVPVDARPDAAEPPPGAVDERLPFPDPASDMLYLVTPDTLIQPGEEKMFCLHGRNDGADLAIDWVDGQQGRYGHHIALYATDAPKAPGTVEDCTDAAGNAALRWFAFGVTFPAGSAIRIPHGMQYVTQFHYLNAGEAPIYVRDVLRLHHVPVASVTRWINSMIATDLDMQVVPGATHVSFDCTVPEAIDAVELWGHMHETGSRIDISVGATASTVQPLYTLDPWKAQYRDFPIVNQYFTQPLHFAAGSVIRITCDWRNATAATLRYPTEMCMMFSYVASEHLTQCTPSSHAFIPLE